MVYEIQTTTKTKWRFRKKIFRRYDIELEKTFEAESGYGEDGSIKRTFFPVTNPECPYWLTNRREFRSIAIPAMKTFRISDERITQDGGIELPAYEIKWRMNDCFELEPMDFNACGENYTLYGYKAEELGEE